MSEARTLTVHVYGHEYRIRSTESGDFVREVALYVDELMHQVGRQMKTGTRHQVAVLAALNIAEELFRLRRDGPASAEDTSEVDDRLRALLGRLDEIAGEPGAVREASGTSAAG